MDKRIMTETHRYRRTVRERDNLMVEIQKLKKEISELNAKLWVARDAQLRTYDGLTTRHDLYKKALEKIRDNPTGENEHTWIDWARYVASDALERK